MNKVENDPSQTPVGRRLHCVHRAKWHVWPAQQVSAEVESDNSPHTLTETNDSLAARAMPTQGGSWSVCLRVSLNAGTWTGVWTDQVNYTSLVVQVTTVLQGR